MMSFEYDGMLVSMVYDGSYIISHRYGTTMFREGDILVLYDIPSSTSCEVLSTKDFSIKYKTTRVTGAEMKCIKREKEIYEAITFDELIEHGKNWEGANIVNGMPWHFQYETLVATHEDDERYIISSLREYPVFKQPMDIRKGDVLLKIWINGRNLYTVISEELFHNTYEIYPDADENQDTEVTLG